MRLPRLGAVRTHEPVSKLARKIEEGTARVLSATVSRTAQRWFVSFTVEVEREEPVRHARPGSAIGVDLGVKTLLTGVDDRGRLITSPGRSRCGRACGSCAGVARALPQTARVGGREERRTAGSPPRPDRQPACGRAAQGDDRLAARYETVVVEDLNVAGMTANGGWRGRSLIRGSGRRGDAGYKTVREGGRLVVADRWFPSSKRCSGCGSVKAKLTLAERVYRCEGCGLVLGRDVNAARNLLLLAASGADRVKPAERR